jgi:hypothetical protein
MEKPIRHFGQGVNDARPCSGQAQLSLRDHLARDPGPVAWSPALLPRIVGEPRRPRPNIGDPMQKLRKDLALYLPD